jgi:sec-independent protein translocase protein TatA
MVLLFGMPNMGEMIFLLVIILLLFGGKKLPELARGLGAGIHEFRRGMNQGNAPVEAQEHVPERDITPHTPEREESHRPKSIPAPKARGGSAPRRAQQAAAMDGARGGSAPRRAQQAAAMDGARGGRPSARRTATPKKKVAKKK